MLANASVHLSKEFVNIMMAHVYTVCPTAIPTLPTPKPGCNELELKESLGMIKGKNGEYEKFDRFMHRTEVSESTSVCRNLFCSWADIFMFYKFKKMLLKILFRCC
jgi:hypothetical protein